MVTEPSFISDSAESELKTTSIQLPEGCPSPISHFDPLSPDNLVTSFNI